MLKNGQTADVTITGYTSDGQGVCRIDGCAVFVPNAIAGELCTVKVVRAGKTAAWGKIERILQPSPHRIPRACPYAKLCGGCQFQHMDYEEETALKAQRVADALTRIGKTGLNRVQVLPAPAVDGYRNKAQYPVAEVNGHPVAGFYKSRTHQVVPIDRCRILPPEADTAKDCVLAWMERWGVRAYDETTGRGLIRHIYVRKAFATGQLLVCLVANGSTLPHTQALIDALKEKLPGLTSVVLSVNQKKTNVVLGDRFLTLYGSGEIEDELCDLRFRLSPRSFYQVNRAQAEKLYRTAIDAAGLTGRETVLDLYCGTGTITLAMARHAGRVLGVEVVEQAIRDARENARRNGIENAEFFCADAAQAAKRLADEGVRPDVVVVDPPRKGLDAAIPGILAQMSPRRIVYVSCDPATLARDLAELEKYGYSAQRAQSLDLFPRCAHVETVVLLSHKKPDGHINVKVEFGEGEDKV